MFFKFISLNSFFFAQSFTMQNGFKNEKKNGFKIVLIMKKEANLLKVKLKDPDTSTSLRLLNQLPTCNGDVAQLVEAA